MVPYSIAIGTSKLVGILRQKFDQFFSMQAFIVCHSAVSQILNILEFRSNYFKEELRNGAI